MFARRVHSHLYAQVSANRIDHLLLVTGVEAELPVPVVGVVSGRSVSRGTGAAIRTGGGRGVAAVAGEGVTK